MKNSKPSLAQFETFLVVAEFKNFTKSAKYLETTKASISLAVKALEDEMGVPLFIRTTRSVTLTHQGELLYTQCQKLKEELDLTRNLVSGLHNAPKGILRISCNGALSETHLLPKLQRYMQKFPQVKIDVRFEERMPDMKHENIDLAFGVNWPGPDDIIARKICYTRYIMCASPDYLKQHGTPASLIDLNNHAYIPHSGRSLKTPLVGLKNKPPTSLHLSNPIQANNIQFIKSCVLKGMGIAQFHDYMVQNEIESGELVEILSDQFNEKEDLFIYYQKNRYVLPKVRQLVNLILNE